MSAPETAKPVDERVEHAHSLADQLGDIEGVKGAVVDSYNPRTADGVRLWVEVEHSGPEMHMLDTRWRLKANLRSVSQKLRHILDSAEKPVSVEVTDRPRSRGDGTHDAPGYTVEVWYA